MMDPTNLVQKWLKEDHKCKICVQARVTEQQIQSDRYTAIVERQGDFAIFFFSAKTIPCFRSDDLNLEEILKVDETFRSVQVSERKSTGFGNNARFMDIFDPLFVKKMESPGADVTGSGPVTLGVRNSEKEVQVELLGNGGTKKFIVELKQAQDVTSQNAAFGLPSSFAWVQVYMDQTQRQQSNPFANDVFDPLSYMNISNPHGVVITADSMEAHTVTATSLEENLTDSLRFDRVGQLRNAESRESLDQLDYGYFDDESQFSDSLGKITHKLGIGGSGVELVNNLKPTTTRESIVRYFMTEREEEFTYKRKLRLFCGTWNVNGQHPPITLAHWLQRDEIPPDIYAIGFQELDLSNQAYVFSDSAKESEWHNVVRKSLHQKAKYRKVKLIRMVGIMLLIYIKENLSADIHFLDSDSVPTGIMGIMGNKGGVGIRITVNSTSMVFINSHLAAHQEEFERRNQDYRDISSKMKFRQFVPPLTLDEHDMVFWIGDLNYRIAGLDIDRVKSMIDKKNYTDLQSYDQLHQQLGRTDVFEGYKEGVITFRPTYKYNPNTDEWDSSEKNRIPAWCDRILYKGIGIQQLQYRSHPDLKVSDHKPVSAVFEVQVKVVEEEKSKKVYEDIMKKLDRLENDYLPQVKLDKTEFTFKDVKFIEPQEQTLTVENVGQVPVKFEFIKKLDESSYCKPWLKVTPFKSVILPGSSCQVQLEVYVEKSSIANLNSNTDMIDDILVLHLHEGKDFFITVNGTFIPSSFGCSVEALVQMHGPIREVPVAQLIEIEKPGSLLKRDITQGGRLYTVPKEIWRLVDHIWKFGKHKDDLFQQPGLHKEMQAIRDCLDLGVPDVIPGSIHSTAEALLLFLESLPEPVIPYSVYQRCLENSNNYTLCKQVLSQIPECHKNVFLYLCAFLRELLSNADHNNLDVQFLASIFGEVLLRSPTQPALTTQRTRSVAKEEEMKRAAFVYHFIINECED